MITTVLFDKDGTLFDFRSVWGDWATGLIGELSGGDADRAAILARALGFDLERSDFMPDSPLMHGTPGDIARSLLPHVPGATPAGLISRMNLRLAGMPQREATPLRPLMELLRARGLRLGVITNDTVSEAREELRRAGILHFFDRVIGADCGYGQKPGPGQINAFLEFSGVAPFQTVMVGDSPQDLVAARAAGVAALGVLTGLTERRQLAPLADAVLPDISQLPEWLLQGRAASNAA